MTVVTETEFSDFQPWGSNATSNWAYLEDNNYLDDFAYYLENAFPDMKITDVTLNDILAYEFEEACQAAGIPLEGEEELKDEDDE